ncbi:F-box/kelch-repeat protein At5g42350-like [Tasmannia lanceolata]|uniref:F-box/kelch-repeat protein At5g42350-like n=1 Tax=Tasmannia lanceolata TaxID=3420 RepID=UPI0040638725
MASIGSYKRSGSNGMTMLLRNDSGRGVESGIVERVVGEASLRKDFEGLSVSRRLVRSLSQRLKKKTYKGDEEEDGNERRVSSGCLCLVGKGGGCKVGAADTSEEFGDGNGRRKSSAGEECTGYSAISGIDAVKADCFPSRVAERLWRRNSRKRKEIERHPLSDGIQFSLPDDVLEMCLVRLPLSSLMNTRLVCKKWRSLTTSPRFMQMRFEGLYQNPWLFLFGVVKDGCCTGQIHALDVSLDQWHRIDADILKGRFSFSVVSVGNDVYIVGGRTSLSNNGRVDKSFFMTHKGVLVFSPLTGSWRETASMRFARSEPVLGVFEVNSDCLIFQSRHDRQDQRRSKSRARGVSDVYEDPHRFSLRRQIRDALYEGESSSESRRKPCKFVNQEDNQTSAKDCRKFVLIAVGGQGSRDEPLDSAEIYDPVSNKWMDIARLPRDFGVVCSGAVCNGIFYVYSETDRLAGYDLERGIWIRIQVAHSPPRLNEYYPKLVSGNDQLFMVCVSWCETDEDISRRDKAVRKVWELDLTLHAWTEISRHPDAPMDWNAAFVAERGRIFGVEMFKIFGQVLDFITMCDLSGSELMWSHISRKHVAHEVDASSCMTKSITVLYL